MEIVISTVLRMKNDHSEEALDSILLIEGPKTAPPKLLN
jgi:hypothetical protein